MCARWPSSLCSLLIWAVLTACRGTVSGNGLAGAPAADGGVYRGDAGSADHRVGEIEPAECRPDPTGFTPCGGSIDGAWRLASICMPVDVEKLREDWMCSELTQEFSSVYRMLVSFDRSGAYGAEVEAGAMQSVSLPFSCIPEDSDCRSAFGEDDTDDSDGRTMLVTMNGDGCAVEVEERRSASEVGTWKISGSELTITTPLGPRTNVYCVTGSTLVIKEVNTATNVVSWGILERL